MGFMRKAAIISTGGIARAAIKPNSKKERTAKATEKMLKMQRAEARRAEAAARAAADQRRTVNDAAPPAPDPVEQLARLAKLRDSGAVTEEEFQAKKTEILGRM